MRKNAALSLFICLLLLFSLSACTGDHKEVQAELSVPEIPADYVYLASENVYLSYSSWETSIMNIPLISGSPLKESDIKVAFGSNQLDTEQYHLGSISLSGTEVTMPFYVYQIYRGKDWADYAAKELAFLDLQEQLSEEYEQAAAELEETRNEFHADYLQLEEQGRLPVLYRYLLQIVLPTDQTISEATEITLYVKDRKLTFPLGKLQYKANSEMPPIGTGIERRRGIAGLYVTFANKEGLFKSTDEVYASLIQATEDVTITNISLWDDSRDISEIEIVITSPCSETSTMDGNGEPISEDIVARFLWDGKSPIELTKGQCAYFNFTFHDPALANVLCGYTQYYLAVEYQDAEGTVFYHLAWYPMSVQTISGDPHELYLAHELDMDVMRYYTEYYDVLQQSTAQINDTSE